MVQDGYTLSGFPLKHDLPVNLAGRLCRLRDFGILGDHRFHEVAVGVSPLVHHINHGHQRPANFRQGILHLGR